MRGPATSPPPASSVRSAPPPACGCPAPWRGAEIAEAEVEVAAGETGATGATAAT